jgi:hypothetical protein
MSPNMKRTRCKCHDAATPAPRDAGLILDDKGQLRSYSHHLFLFQTNLNMISFKEVLSQIFYAYLTTPCKLQFQTTVTLSA